MPDLDTRSQPGGSLRLSSVPTSGTSSVCGPTRSVPAKWVLWEIEPPCSLPLAVSAGHRQSTSGETGRARDEPFPEFP